MFEFLLTPEGLKVVAFCTAALTAILFALGAHPFGTKRTEPSQLWVAGDYYTYLRAFAISCCTIEQLNDAMKLIDRYNSKQFRVPISLQRRKEYYSSLLETYYQKEAELKVSDKESFELCANRATNNY